MLLFVKSDKCQLALLRKLYGDNESKQTVSGFKCCDKCQNECQCGKCEESDIPFKISMATEANVID